MVSMFFDLPKGMYDCSTFLLKYVPVKNSGNKLVSTIVLQEAQSWRSRKPSPPESLGVHISSYAIQCKPLPFCFEFHQKLEVVLLSLSEMPCGSK